MFLFLNITLLLIVQSVLSDEIYSSTYSVADQCLNLCNESRFFIASSINSEENDDKIVCQRGCKFFNIIRFKDDLNLNTTKKECHLSCEESYDVAKQFNVCKAGCDLMAKKRQNELYTILIITEEDVDKSNDIVLAEPDLELLETDILSDPSIKSQLEIGFNIDYKIPETRIRTMPIQIIDSSDDNEEIQIKINGGDASTGGDWLDCASRNSGIPRWILLTVILSAVLIALWLSFSTERKGEDEEDIADDNDNNMVDISDDKLILCHHAVDDDDDLDRNVRFSYPPQYSVTNETV